MGPIADPLRLKARQEKFQVIASGFLPDETVTPFVAGRSFRDECFAVACGIGLNRVHAASFAAETAVWGYTHIRTRRFYWQDKKLFIKRIFRSVNLAMWQRRRETEYADGLISTLSVIIVSRTHAWVGCIGDAAVYRFQDGRGDFIVKATSDEAVGRGRNSPPVTFRSEPFDAGDVFLVTTPQIIRELTADDLLEDMGASGASPDSLLATRTIIQDKARVPVPEPVAIIKKVPTKGRRLHFVS